MDDFVLAKAMAIRELGYTHVEITGKLSLRDYQLQYALAEVNEQARPTSHDYPKLRLSRISKQFKSPTTLPFFVTGISWRSC